MYKRQEVEAGGVGAIGGSRGVIPCILPISSMILAISLSLGLNSVLPIFLKSSWFRLCILSIFGVLVGGVAESRGSELQGSRSRGITLGVEVRALVVSLASRRWCNGV